MPYLIFFTLVVSMLACHIIAKNKGRNPVAWGITGALLGPIGIIVVLLMPTERIKK